MGFKKHSKPKKKKSKKRTTDREWDHEGGQELVENNEKKEPIEPGAKRARRETQDRDERLRRGRAKIAFQNEKRNFTKKMNNGIKFKDELLTTVSAVKVEKTPSIPHIQFKSSRSVFERLQDMVVGSITKKKIIAVPANKITEGEISSNELLEQTAQSADDNEDSEVESSEPSCPPADLHDWFFSSTTMEFSATEHGRYKLLTQCFSSDVYANLNPDIDAGLLKFARCKVINDIPSCQKVFRPRLQERFSKNISQTLPLLYSFADIFVDGCTEFNIPEVEMSLSVYIAHHIMRSRYE